MTSPKIGEAFCDADVIFAGGPAENLIVRKCDACGTVWAHEPNATLLSCPFCSVPAIDGLEEVNP
jgi:hypothetical protein